MSLHCVSKEALAEKLKEHSLYPLFTRLIQIPSPSHTRWNEDMHDTGGPDELLESLRKTKTENYVHGDNSSIPGQLCFMLKVVLVPAFTLHG